MMNTVANNVQLCITSQSRKINSLAFILECLFCFCIAYNFIKTGKCRSRGYIPQKNFCCIPPNSSHCTVCNFENSRSPAIKELVNGFRFWGGMHSVSLLAQSFCRSITHTAEQDHDQNAVWFELLS